MIVLVQPMYSKKELNADSNYVVYTTLIRAMLNRYPTWHFVVIFPDAGSGFAYEDDGFFKLPRVTRLPQRIVTRKMANAVSFDGGWWDALVKRFGFDVVWCNLVESAGHIKNAGESHYDPTGAAVVVAAHNYVIHESLPYPMHAMMPVALQQVHGAVCADHNVFNSDHCKRMFFDNARAWLSDVLVKDIEARSSRIDYGTLEPEFTYRESGNDVPVIAYNHRLQAYKQWRSTFAVLDALHRDGVRFRLRYMNNTADNLSHIRSYPWVEVKLTTNRAEYVENLAGCDLNVTNSVHETFCISGIESMALGQPFVAPAGVTFPEITGVASGATSYPYLFTNEAEQSAILRRLLTDAAERKKWGRVLSEYVRGAYNSDLWAQRYGALFERLCADRVPNIKEDALEMCRRALRENSGKTLNEWLQSVRQVPVGDRIPFGTQAMPAVRGMRTVRLLGGSVRMERGEQRVYA